MADVSPIDYWAIREEVRELILAENPSFTVELEREMAFSPEQSPWVGIYLESRQAPERMQRMAAATRLRYRLPITLWLFTYALELQSAIRARDEALARLEHTLMGAGTLNELVEFSWLEGGRMISGRVEDSAVNAFTSGAELVLVAEVLLVR